jgi:hypothetical protein
MDTSKIKEAYVELERLHSRIIQTEQQINNIELELDISKFMFSQTSNSFVNDFNSSENTDE